MDKILKMSRHFRNDSKPRRLPMRDKQPSRVKPSEYLQRHGWRMIGSQGSIKYWDHVNHQPDERGAFTTTDATEHQKQYEVNGWCDCVKTMPTLEDFINRHTPDPAITKIVELLSERGDGN